jgi:hypothetical protein
MTITTDLIGYDPTIITITRHSKAANAGGFSWTTADLDPIEVRLYHYTTRNQREWNTPEGEVKQIVLGILAEPGVNIIVGHDSYDTFVVGSRTYRIVGVRDYDDSNVDPCTQADCVAV